MEKLSQVAFNELMDNAFKTQAKYPNVSLMDIVTLACAPYQGRDDYGDLTYQVAYALVNANK